jgi:hypothetical protein
MPTRSSTGVSLQSPYGARGPYQPWLDVDCTLMKGLRVCVTLGIPSVNNVVTSPSKHPGRRTVRIVWIHARLGNLL